MDVEGAVVDDGSQAATAASPAAATLDDQPPRPGASAGFDAPRTAWSQVQLLVDLFRHRWPGVSYALEGGSLSCQLLGGADGGAEARGGAEAAGGAGAEYVLEVVRLGTQEVWLSQEINSKTDVGRLVSAITAMLGCACGGRTCRPVADAAVADAAGADRPRAAVEPCRYSGDCLSVVRPRLEAASHLLASEARGVEVLRTDVEVLTTTCKCDVTHAISPPGEAGSGGCGNLSCAAVLHAPCSSTWAASCGGTHGESVPLAGSLLLRFPAPGAGSTSPRCLLVFQPDCPHIEALHCEPDVCCALWTACPFVMIQGVSCGSHSCLLFELLHHEGGDGIAVEKEFTQSLHRHLVGRQAGQRDHVECLAEMVHAGLTARPFLTHSDDVVWCVGALDRVGRYLRADLSERFGDSSLEREALDALQRRMPALPWGEAMGRANETAAPAAVPLENVLVGTANFLGIGVAGARGLRLSALLSYHRNVPCIGRQLRSLSLLPYCVRCSKVGLGHYRYCNNCGDRFPAGRQVLCVRSRCYTAGAGPVHCCQTEATYCCKGGAGLAKVLRDRVHNACEHASLARSLLVEAAGVGGAQERQAGQVEPATLGLVSAAKELLMLQPTQCRGAFLEWLMLLLLETPAAATLLERHADVLLLAHREGASQAAHAERLHQTDSQLTASDGRHSLSSAIGEHGLSVSPLGLQRAFRVIRHRQSRPWFV